MKKKIDPSDKKGKRKFKKDVFSVKGICDKCEQTMIELDKGAYWRKCCDGNYSFLEWKVDPTEFTNDDFKLKYDKVTTTYDQRYANPFNINENTIIIYIKKILIILKRIIINIFYIKLF